MTPDTRRTTAEEIENLRKCVKAGFDIVVAVPPSKYRRTRIRKAVAVEFSEAEQRRIKVLGPGDVERLLRDSADGPLPPPIPTAGDAVTHQETIKQLGYKVIDSYESLTPEKQKKVEDDFIKKVTDAMKEERKKKPDPSD